jgi:hypothetical protein
MESNEKLYEKSGILSFKVEKIVTNSDVLANYISQNFLLKEKIETYLFKIVSFKYIIKAGIK